MAAGSSPFGEIKWLSLAVMARLEELELFAALDLGALPAALKALFCRALRYIAVLRPEAAAAAAAPKLHHRPEHLVAVVVFLELGKRNNLCGLLELVLAKLLAQVARQVGDRTLERTVRAIQSTV